jgi:hypothetical protein
MGEAHEIFQNRGYVYVYYGMNQGRCRDFSHQKFLGAATGRSKGLSGAFLPKNLRPRPVRDQHRRPFQPITAIQMFDGGKCLRNH